MQLTYNEYVDIFDVKNIVESIDGYTLPPGIYEISDISLMIKYLLPNMIKVEITNDDSGL